MIEQEEAKGSQPEAKDGELSIGKHIHSLHYYGLTEIIDEELRVFLDKSSTNSQKSEDEGSGASEESNIYEVERLMGVQVIQGVEHYNVKWEGYDQGQNTWEPISNFVYMDLENFLNILSHSKAYLPNVKDVARKFVDLKKEQRLDRSDNK